MLSYGILCCWTDRAKMATRTNEREKDRGHRGLKLVLTTDGRNRQPSTYLRTTVVHVK